MSSGALRSNRRWLSAFIAILAIFVAIWLAWTIYKLFVVSSVTAKLGVLTAATSIAAVLYNNSRQQKREIRSRHFAEKRQAYQKFFDFFFDIFSANRKGEELSEAEIIERMHLVVKEMMTWGSADTINHFNKFIKQSATNPSVGIDLFNNVEILLRSLRRDLGHDDQKLDNLALTKLLIKGDEHDKLDSGSI